MRIYPSCLYNRISEARRLFPSVEGVDWKLVRYPYNMIDLAVRMRPIVEVINSVKGFDPKIKLLNFEASGWFDGNKKYIAAREVSIVVLLGAIIHESYVYIGPTQDSPDRQQLDVQSDRGRWIVCFDESICATKRYLLNTDDVAETVCDMIDNHQKLLSTKRELRWKAPPNIGTLDLHWLLWVYLSQNPKMKKTIVSSIFSINSIPKDNFKALRFPTIVLVTRLLIFTFPQRIGVRKSKDENVWNGECSRDWLGHFCQDRNGQSRCSRWCGRASAGWSRGHRIVCLGEVEG